MPESNHKPMRYSVGCLLPGVTLISGCVSSYVGFLRWADGEDEIAIIDCGSNCEIVITAARSWEISQPIYYLVRVDGEIVVPTTYIDSNYPDDDPSAIRFAKFATSNGNLVGIIYADTPNDYLIVHDFADNASIPRGEHIKWDHALDVTENRNVRDHARAELENKLNSSRPNERTTSRSTRSRRCACLECTVTPAGL
jgi:hypothetical protein